jgi:hypothetical protein
MKRKTDAERSEVEKIFWRIQGSEVFERKGKEIDLMGELIALCDAIRKNKVSQREWLLGEDYGFTLSDLLTGAYYALAELHAGKRSDTYAALCAVATIYQPSAYGYDYERDTGEETVYEGISYHLFDPINDKMIKS